MRFKCCERVRQHADQNMWEELNHFKINNSRSKL